MSGLAPLPLEGVVTERADRIEDLCQGTVEMLTEFDWAEIPPAAQDELRAWWLAFREWAREK